MPICEVETNIPSDKVPKEFEFQLTDLLADSMGKPKWSIGVIINAGKRLIHGGTADPVAITTIRSIGKVSAEENIKHMKRITEFYSQQLGLPAEKLILTSISFAFIYYKNQVFVNFVDLQPHCVGINGTTVAEAFK
ncbi:hypothetical protein WR25_09897 [Diploscapter pachys]|uniref:Uncharacterized protein n=1 Tax=Diploscapter pachys TaxID=2018661 RepID=A0A2A2JCB4_9BILA|nr:hypothetical protein WR25_09897 [Diploscapter pachys]